MSSEFISPRSMSSGSFHKPASISPRSISGRRISPRLATTVRSRPRSDIPTTPTRSFPMLPCPSSTVLIAIPQQELLGQATLRLTDRWSVGGLARYEIDNGGLLYDSVLLKYADECFVLTASYIESNFNDGTIVPDQTFMLRFEFKHLGDFRGQDRRYQFRLRRRSAHELRPSDVDAGLADCGSEPDFGHSSCG